MVLRRQNSIAATRLQRKTSLRSIFTPEEESILITLIYSSIFSFPLTKDELWKYLITKEKIPKKMFHNRLKLLRQHIVQKQRYICIKGEDASITQRIANSDEVAKKFALAKQASVLVSMIPTVLFIGASGGLAAKNVTAEDDIDFFIITKQDTIYITRFLVMLLLQRKGLRRSRNQQDAPNKICVNLIIDEKELSWNSAKRDIYTAREIAQVQPLFERENMYKRFLNKNKWVTEFLPNAFSMRFIPLKQEKHSMFTSLISMVLSLPPFEILSRLIQQKIMQKHKTTETVTNHHLAFHPKDYRLEVLRQLKLKMKDLGLLTKI